jgi:acyl-[acyl-carrier-protein]-phospholipid O-acyltransferase / long-chain-fatty-acid--[acyl-carrier-protein] ligase
VSFGSPLTPPVTPQQVRQAVMELGCAAAEGAIGRRGLLQTRFIRSAKRNWRRLAMADSTGKELTYGKALTASMLLADRLRAQQPEEKMVGIMLPASVGGALANIAVLMAGKAPVNLNFTAGKEAVASAIEQCQIRTILTSRLLLSKLKLQPPASTVFVEDLLAQCSKGRVLLVAAKARLLPARVLAVLCNPARLDSGDLAAVIFSSGSTGRPKGVMLSHKNVGANVDSIDQIFSLEKSDCIAGVLPFFHSFGFTITLWFPLLTGIGVVYHPDPLDGKAVGALVARYKATMLLATPSFCKGYTRTCSREQFASLRFVIVGAEKLLEPAAKAFEEKFGLPMLEGYGCTEMAPVVAVNVSDAQDQTERQIGYKPGSVGHPIPGVAARVVDLNTGEPLPYNQEGLLLVKGPNRMTGYLGQPERTREVIEDDWYVTGDIACIDEDGFIRITDRLSRFSKIGGEMVPHLRIEEALQPFLEDRSCVVVAIPDEQKGERLVVFHTKRDFTPDEVRERLSRAELPKLWIPKRESIHFIEALPTIGTGKLDFVRLKTLAMKSVSAASPANSDEAS